MSKLRAEATKRNFLSHRRRRHSLEGDDPIRHDASFDETNRGSVARTPDLAARVNTTKRGLFRLILAAAVAFTTGALFGCGKTKAPPAPLLVSTSDASTPAANLPLRLNDAIWDPDTGDRLRTAAESERAWPPPLPWSNSDPRITFHETTLERKGIWSTNLGKSINPNWPVFVVAEKKNRIVVATSTDLELLDFTSGARLGTVQGTANARMLLHSDGEILVAMDPTSPPTPDKEKHVLWKRWMIARRADDLKELWRFALPRDASFTTIAQVGKDTFSVSTSKWTAFVSATDGTSRFVLRDEDVHFASALEGVDRGFLIGTDKRIMAVDRVGEKLWERQPLGTSAGLTGSAGVTLTLPDHRGVIVFGYAEGADSDVDLALLNPENGNETYRVTVQRFGVAMHSEYYHAAFVRARDGKLDVLSIASGGIVAEVRDAATGKKIKRWKPPMDTVP